jgi:hypothetical protein
MIYNNNDLLNLKELLIELIDEGWGIDSELFEYDSVIVIEQYIYNNYPNVVNELINNRNYKGFLLDYNSFRDNDGYEIFEVIDLTDCKNVEEVLERLKY